MRITKEQLKHFFTGQVFLHLASFAILIFSLSCFFANFTHFNFNSTFNSDSIGVPYIFKDIFLDGGHLKDWNLASAPTLFPDMVLYYLLFLVFKTDFITLTFAFGVIQTLLIVGSSCYIFRKLTGEKIREYSWFIPLFYSFMFFESYYIINDQMLGFLMTIYSYHTGSFVNTLLSFSLVVSGIKPSWKMIMLFVLACLGVYSDFLYIVTFILPFVVLSIVQYDYFGIKRTLYTLAMVLAGAFVGYKLFASETTSGTSNHASFDHIVVLDRISKCIDVMYMQVSYEFQKTGFQQWLTIIAFTVPLLALIIVIAFRKRIAPPMKYLTWYYLLFVIITISVALFTGAYDSTDKIRYIVGVYFLSAVVLAFIAAVVLSYIGKIQWLKAGVTMAVLVLFFCIPYNKFSWVGLKNYFSYYPPAVRSLDEICEKHHLKRGIADYWVAKWASIFSKKGIVVLTVFPSINIYNYGSNSEWYFSKEYDFVIPDRLDTAQIRKNFVILDTIQTPEITVLKVKKYIYLRNEPFPKTIE